MYAGMETGCILNWDLKNRFLNICYHQGRTDQSGGHHDWLNRMGLGFGYYHYHHKLPAHLHPHGVCPYGELKTSIINPYTGKKIDLGMPYFYKDNPYFSLNLVSRALTADDELGVDLTDKDTGGSFYACSAGDSSKEEGLGEQIFFTCPEDFFGIQNNTFFQTDSDELQLLCHTKKSAADDILCYAYISLETIGVYMTKDGYFTDFCDGGSGVWNFNVRKPGVQIIMPQNGGLFHVGDELTVEADIENVSHAALIVGNTFFGYTDGFAEYKYNLDGQSTVTFTEFKLTEDQIGSLPVRVEVHTGGTSMQADIDAHTISSGLRIRVDGPGNKVYANDETDKNRLADQEQIANAEYIYNYLNNQGWTTEAVCGLFGNIHRESHFNPGIWQNKDVTVGSPGIGSGYGLVQWTPSGEKFLDWAWPPGEKAAGYANNIAINNAKQLMDLQLDYLIYSCLSTTSTSSIHRQGYGTTDYDSPYKMTYEEYIVSTYDPGDLALVFHGAYERSNDTATIRDERVKNAENWYTYFTTGQIPKDLFDR